ncbi:MAG TPA: hypothetical protein VKC51_06255 [Lacunisphaera sp.]|nr:hypothetical protein [Lacunisphaera sp.]
MSESNPFVTFEEAERAALAIGANMTMPERVRWLEEAELFSLQLQSSRWKTGLGVDRRLRPLMEARYGPAPQRVAVAEEQAKYLSAKPPPPPTP